MSCSIFNVEPDQSAYIDNWLIWINTVFKCIDQLQHTQLSKLKIRRSHGELIYIFSMTTFDIKIHFKLAVMLNI